MLVSLKTEKPIGSAFFISKERDDTHVTAILLKRKPKTNGGMSMNEKLIINTNLLRKEPEFKTYTCVVEKAVPVPTEEFERLKHAPMCNNDLISENLNSMWYGNGVHHCLLIYDKQQGDGLLIESEGAPYARHAQFIPNAKLLYENHMQTHLQELKFCCPLEAS